MPALVRPDLAHMPSFLAALREGYARDTRYWVRRP